MGLNCLGPLICGLLSINIQSAFRIPGFWICRFDQPPTETVFLIWGWESQDGRTNCVHSSTSFPTRTWTSQDFRVGVWGWNQRLGNRVMGKSELYVGFRLLGAAPTPALFKGPLCILSKDTFFSFVRVLIHSTLREWPRLIPLRWWNYH